MQVVESHQVSVAAKHDQVVLEHPREVAVPCCGVLLDLRHDAPLALTPVEGGLQVGGIAQLGVVVARSRLSGVVAVRSPNCSRGQSSLLIAFAHFIEVAVEALVLVLEDK